MTALAPSVHAARAGAWALLLVLVVDLAADLGLAFVQYRALGSGDDLDARDDWYRWLDWFGDGWPWLQGVLVALVVLALVRLRRGTKDHVARNLCIGAACAWSLRVGVWLAMQLVDIRGDDAGVGFWERLQLVATVADRVALGLVLAALWRARRGWGRGSGAAWTIGAAIYALRSAYQVASLMEWLGPREVESDAFLGRLLVIYGFGAAELVALAATLVAFGGAAPEQPEAGRWTAAAAGLDTYRRALVTRVAVLLVGVAVMVMLGLGRAPAWSRGAVLLGTLALQLPVAVAQIAGLTRYADAPAPIARGGLWTALVVVGLGLAVECMVLAALVVALWQGPSSWGAPTPAMLRDVAAAGQALGLVAGVALLVSLRRAAESVASPALQARAEGLLVALVVVAAVGAGLVFAAGEALARSPWVVLGLGLVGLAIGVTVFIGWLRLIAGVAREMRQRSTGE